MINALVELEFLTQKALYRQMPKNMKYGLDGYINILSPELKWNVLYQTRLI